MTLWSGGTPLFVCPREAGVQGFGLSTLDEEGQMAKESKPRAKKKVRIRVRTQVAAGGFEPSPTLPQLPTMPLYAVIRPMQPLYGSP